MAYLWIALCLTVMMGKNNKLRQESHYFFCLAEIQNLKLINIKNYRISIYEFHSITVLFLYHLFLLFK